MSKLRSKGSSGSSKSLPFKEITARLNTDELIKRLKACLKYLEDIDELELNLFQPLLAVSSVLVSPNISSHKSREIQLLTACVQANLYRLFIPEIPHNEEQTKAIFNLFISQLDGLKKPSSVLYKWTFSLVEILSTMKIFTLCLSFDSHEILVDLFEKIYSVVIPDQATQIHHFLLDIVVTVIQEAEQLPQKLLDVLLLPILEPQKIDNPLIYEFTCKVIKRSSQYLEPYIQMFYSSVLIGGEESDSELCSHLYTIIEELYSIDSYLLLSVLPQLEWKLKCNDTEERLSVTTLLGRMFSCKGSPLSIENKPLWLCYLGRFQDVSVSIRSECVKSSRQMLTNHSLLKEDITAKLLERLLDTEEKVRLESVRSIIEAAAEDMSCVPDKLLLGLQERMRDRKWPIRKYTITSLSRLYRQVMGSVSSEKDRVQWIPNKLLHSYYQPYPEDKLSVVTCFVNCIVPVSLANAEEKMDRLLHVYNKLDENAVRAFVEILKNQRVIRQHLLAMLNVFNEENEEEEKKRVLILKSSSIAGCLPDPLKAQDNLRELQSILESDADIRSYLRQAIDVSSSISKITSAKTELLSKLSSHSNISDTVQLILDLSSPVLVDRNCVNVLTLRVTKGLCDPALSSSQEEETEEEQRCQKGLVVLKYLAGFESVWFHNEETLENLLSLLRHNDDTIVQNAILIMSSVGPALIEQFNSVASCLQPLLVQLSLKGSPETAKRSVNCLVSLYPNNKSIFERLYESLVSKLDLECPQLLTVLVSLGQLARRYHRVFERQRNHVINTFVVKQILDKVDMDDSTGDSEEQEREEKLDLWCKDEDLSQETALKIISMKLLVYWIIGFPPERATDRNKAVVPVLQLLTRTLTDGGDLHRRGIVIPPERSRLRLVASCHMLKLAAQTGLNDIITLKQFECIALTSQDPCEEVRDAFIVKLHKGLRNFALPLRYMSIFSLSAADTRKQAKLNWRQMLNGVIEQRRKAYQGNPKARLSSTSVLPEYSLPFVVYLMSHHPSFRRIDHKSLETFRDCLWFYLEPLISKSDNFGFLCKMLESIKQLVDAESPDDTELNKDIYAVCDLASGVLYGKIGKASVGEFPGELLVPKILFVPRKKGSPPNDQKYLPPDFVVFPEKMTKMDAILKSPSNSSKRPRPSKKGTKSADSSVNNITISSDVESTPSPAKKQKRGGSTKRSQTKQSKLNFKAKAPVTSTPVTVVTKKSPKKGTRQSKRQSIKRRVLEKLEEEQEASPQEEMETQQEVNLQEEAETHEEEKSKEDVETREEVTPEKSKEEIETQEGVETQEEVSPKKEEEVTSQRETPQEKEEVKLPQRTSPRKRGSKPLKLKQQQTVPVQKKRKLEEKTNISDVDTAVTLVRKSKRLRK